MWLQIIEYCITSSISMWKFYFDNTEFSLFLVVGKTDFKKHNFEIESWFC